MSAPTSPVDICSLAMEYLSDQALTSVDAPITPAEAVASRWYDMTRRSLLRRHPWNFAIKRTSLARNSTTPEFGYADAYDLPDDFVRHIEILSSDMSTTITDYEIENGQILCDNSGGALYVRYVYDLTIVSKFDALFVDVLALELAMRICRKITGNNDLVPGIKEILKDLVADAFSVDGQERPPKRVERSNWKAARRRAFAGGTDKTVFA
jgi:hypothetical protein